MSHGKLPLLPLVLDDIPRGLLLALGQEGIPFRTRQAGVPQGRFVLYDSGRSPVPTFQQGQTGIDVDRLRRRHDDDPFEALLDERAAPFRWDIEGIQLTEVIAAVDKRRLRRQVLGGLRALIERAGGIWLRVSAFPFPYRSAFNFRIDYDEYEPRDFQATMAAIAGREAATTHFVNGAAYESASDAVARLRGLDVGSHAYHHHTYQTEAENLHNVGRGIETLVRLGIEPSGFAAPGGRFNRSLLAALETLKVSHASEFGLAYDELPFGIGVGGLLQLPIHPVCLGLFLDAIERQGASGDQTVVRRAVDLAGDYFERTICEKHQLGEPAFLYGHPTRRLGRHSELLDRAFTVADRFQAMWKTTLSEFAAWWRARADVRLTVTRGGDRFVVLAKRKPLHYRVGIEYWRGDHLALMSMDGSRVAFSPGALAYEKRDGRQTVRPARIDQSQGLRGRVQRLIDWERVTPVEEISSATWRNRVKRTLRRWR